MPPTLADFATAATALNNDRLNPDLHTALASILKAGSHASAAAKHEIIAHMLQLKPQIDTLMKFCPEFQGTPMDTTVHLGPATFQACGERGSNTGIDTRILTTEDGIDYVLGSFNDTFMQYVEEVRDGVRTLIMLEELALTVAKKGKDEVFPVGQENNELLMNKPVLDEALIILQKVRTAVDAVLASMMQIRRVPV